MRPKCKIAWADSLLNECGHTWEPKEGETIEGIDEITKEVLSYPARGQHVCVKQAGHESDPTNDDHQCCCGNSTWETP